MPGSSDDSSEATRRAAHQGLGRTTSLRSSRAATSWRLPLTTASKAATRRTRPKTGASPNFCDGLRAREVGPLRDLVALRDDLHDTFLHLAFKRNTTTGDTYITFELNQSEDTWVNAEGETIPCRSDGDLLISYEVGGSSLDVTVYRWEGDGTGPTDCPDGANGSFVPGPTQLNLGTINTTDITNYLNPARYGSTFEAGSFGEAQLDLPAALKMMGESPCFSFVQVQAHTRSSSSISSALIDYIEPVPAYVSSCSASGTVYSDANRTALKTAARPGLPGARST